MVCPKGPTPDFCSPVFLSPSYATWHPTPPQFPFFFLLSPSPVNNTLTLSPHKLLFLSLFLLLHHLFPKDHHTYQPSPSDLLHFFCPSPSSMRWILEPRHHGNRCKNLENPTSRLDQDPKPGRLDSVALNPDPKPIVPAQTQPI